MPCGRTATVFARSSSETRPSLRVEWTWWSKSITTSRLRMAGPCRVDHRPEHARDERLAAQEQRDLRFRGGLSELAQSRMLDRGRLEEVRREAIRRARPPAEVREQHARVEQHPVG